MTIRRRETWGRIGPVPSDAVEVRADAEAAEVVARCRAEGSMVPPLLLRAGDLWRTCGGSPRPRDATEVAILPVDLGVAVIDGVERIFVAHLVGRRRSPWFGPMLAVCNAQYIGRFDVAPRSHPGDGRLDVLEVGTMPLRDRWKARRRLPAGTHVPHPAITQRRVASATFAFDEPRRVWLDGDPIGRVHELAVRCEPDAFTVCV